MIEWTTDEKPPSDATKARRLSAIKSAASRMRRSITMRAMWERRREQMREFLDDDAQHNDHAGSADVDIEELPDTL